MTINYFKTIIFVLCLAAIFHNNLHAAEKLNYHLSPVTPVQAENFSLPDMDDNIHQLSDYKGKIVMINFWATWCPPCRQEMPSMNALYNKFNQLGFIVLGINQWETQDRVFMFTGELDTSLDFPILFDPNGSVSNQFGVKGLPTTVLVNKQGQVVYRAIGGRDFNHPAVEKIIKSLLNN